MAPKTDAAPVYCKVSAKILRSLNFEVRIPDSWNGKLHYGGGGFNGYIPPVLAKGYIAVSSDSGHQGSPVDASWAIGNPQAEELHGHLSIPTVMSSVIEMIAAAYGRAPARSYFEGCSNGGREGLIMAQRYPNLFDGIISGCPVLGMPALVGTYNRVAKALTAPGGKLTQAKVKLLSNAVIAACDAQDGIADGVLSNPGACNFKPEMLRCSSGGDAGDSCLSDAQLAVVTAWTTPTVFTKAAIRYPGFALTGSEGYSGAWDTWVLDPKTPLFVFQDPGIKSLIERNPKMDPLAYDYDSNPAALSRWSALVDPNNPDLRPFRDSGGKRGADSVDLLAALDRWLETGNAPAKLMLMKRATDGSAPVTRPVCKYPQYARYTGPANDVTAARLASNYFCTMP